MSELANPLELGGYATSFTTGFLQFAKQWPFFKNEWCRIAAPIVALLFLLAWYWLALMGTLWLIQMLAVAFGTSTAGEGIYNIQKPLGFLSKGPDGPATSPPLMRPPGPPSFGS